jgi:hypothetical protein
MDTRTQEDASGPLGVIGSLMAGFEMVGRHLGLIVLPVLLDLFLWLGPRLSVAPLVQQFIALLMAQPVPDPAVARQIEQVVHFWEQSSEQFNLLSLLSALPLLDVPTLLAQHVPEMGTPLGEPRVFLVTSVLTLVVWMAVLIPIGMVLGFLYLNGLTCRVRAMRSDEVEEALRFSGWVNKIINVFLFISGLMMAGVVLFPLWLLVVGITLMIAPPLGLLIWLISVGLGGYVALNLLFVVPGMLLGNRGLFQATLESFMLIQIRFPSVVALILLVVVIYEGLGFVWSLPSGGSWMLLIGILGNGCIATGLTAATFVFYQEQIGQLPKLDQPSKT